MVTEKQEKNAGRNATLLMKLATKWKKSLQYSLTLNVELVDTKKKIIVEEDYKGNTVKTGNSFII